MSAPATVRAGVVGGGLGGAMMALYLARRGFEVRVFDRRPDLRREFVAGPSMNLGLSRRGIESLSSVGLADEVLRLAIPMNGRVVHDLDGGLAFQPYGRNGDEVIHAVRRNDINSVLLDAAESSGNVRLCFGQRLFNLDRDRGEAWFRDEQTGHESTETADFWVGADGLFSTVRQLMQRKLRADYQQEFLDWGWKELRIPPGPGGTFRLEKNAFHLWPRGGAMLFAHPNPDGSFTCSLVLPLEGERSLESLSGAEQVQRFFEETFPDLVPLIPDLGDQFLANRVVSLVTIRTSPWHYRDRVVLLADSAHAVVPFYAQGMNAAFEDCAVLDQCLARHGTARAAAFAEYYALRRRHTDALAEMSKQNFLELRDKVRSPWLRGRRKLDNLLNRWLGESWAPLHARVTNTTIPYAEALELERRQDRILAWTGLGLVAALLGAVSVLGTDRWRQE
ncbi:MAG TPA: NAD(P)/FAD-dependent oxidoreductase [Thermoanaerobaculia bacterium]|nr:NAD(P)/FAD-dependent oxidoreductase [Thermoanaerobaculia bacterium]